jgi:hypothetical protein
MLYVYGAAASPERHFPRVHLLLELKMFSPG